MKFMGFERSDGSVGIRNIVIVMAVADCSEPVAKMIAENEPGAVAITQHYGCIPGSAVANIMIGVGQNPNVGGVILVEMGCEGMPAQPLAKKIEEAGKPVKWVSIQESGGTANAIESGKKMLTEILEELSKTKRQEFNVDKLAVGIKCGGSDTTSGLAGNPAVGFFADRLIEAGGSVLMSEPVEAVGAEGPLAKRALNPEIREKILRMIGNEEKRLSVPGAQMEFMCKGNVDGGLTSIEEKALGAVHKSGSKPVKDVLQFNDKTVEKIPSGGGLYLQDATHIEPMSMSIMAAAGVQLVVFVTGCGATFGHAVVPFIKITGNPHTYPRMSNDIDINAGTIITGEESLESVGSRIFQEVMDVASGKETLGERLGYRNFSIFRRDPRLEVLLQLSE